MLSMKLTFLPVPKAYRPVVRRAISLRHEICAAMTISSSTMALMKTVIVGVSLEHIGN